MFNKTTKNTPQFSGGANTVGLFANFRAKYTEGVFMFQVLVPLVESTFYIRLFWNKWYPWKKCSAVEMLPLS